MQMKIAFLLVLFFIGKCHLLILAPTASTNLAKHIAKFEAKNNKFSYLSKYNVGVNVTHKGLKIYRWLPDRDAVAEELLVNRDLSTFVVGKRSVDLNMDKDSRNKFVKRLSDLAFQFEIQKSANNLQHMMTFVQENAKGFEFKTPTVNIRFAIGSVQASAEGKIGFQLGQDIEIFDKAPRRVVSVKPLEKDYDSFMKAVEKEIGFWIDVINPNAIRK